MWTLPNLPDFTNWSVVALDTETHDPDLQEKGPGFVYDNAYIIGFSVCSDSGFNDYFPVRHVSGNIEGDWRGWLRALLSRDDITIVTANGRYDIEALWVDGIPVRSRVMDIQVIEALLDEEQSGYSLDKILARRGLPTKSKGSLEEELVRRGLVVQKGRGPATPDWTRLKDLEPSFVAEYATYDAKGTYDIFMQQINDVVADELQEVVALECELGPILIDMRIRGVPVDIPAAEKMNEEFKTECEEMLKQIKFSSGMDINPFSSQSIARYLDSIGITVPKTEKNNDSVTTDYLETINHPACELLAKYRSVEKIRRDFVEGMVLDVSYKGRLHPQYFQTRGSSFMSGDDVNGTRSGRIGVLNPNLAQIPKRYPVYGKRVRSLFIPEVGEEWCKADYNQQEPRILLHFAYLLKLDGTEAARQIYVENPETDYHQMMTNRVNRVRPEKPITRGAGKDINLGLAYGLGKVKMADRLGIPRSECNSILDSYHEGNPFVRQLQYRCIDVATRRGYVKTMLGRKRRFNLWESPHWPNMKGKRPLRDRDEAIKLWGTVRRAMTHKALNSIVQGSAADQMKKAMIMLWKEGFRPLVTLYDELDHSISDRRQALRIKEVMETAVPFTVPHYVVAEIGPNWGFTEVYRDAG
jgi:DNA polymerase I-like protein with 3'-5' exonuclease and polymerase domains